MNHRMTKNNRISSMTYHQNPWRQPQMVKRDFLLGSARASDCHTLAAT